MINTRHRSRRHLAALTFLSNISLDGTHRDTNLGRYYNIGKALATNESQEKENLRGFEAVTVAESGEKSYTKGYIKKSQEVLPELDLHGNHLYQSSDAIHERSSKEKFNGAVEYRHSVKKRSGYHISIAERSNYLSSNESIGANTGTSNSLSRGRKSSLTSSEISLNKEIKSLRIEGVSKFKDERLVFVSKNKIPCHIFSCISFNRYSRHDYALRESGRRRHASGTRPLSTISDSTDPAHVIGLSCLEDPAEISFCDLLIPSKSFSNRYKRLYSDNSDSGEFTTNRSSHQLITRCLSYEPTSQKTHYTHSGTTLSEREEFHFGRELDIEYMPDLLDDPELRAGKHRKLLRFSSYMTSVTDYTKPLDLKKELNDKFKEKFPPVQLTLSKLRSLKRELLKIAKQECDMDILTVAQAYVYFEKMILKMYVNKQNRKLIAGACLILSAKMNDVKGDQLTNLIEKTETLFRLNRRELLSWELASLVALEFGLHVPSWQINPHYKRLQFES